MGGAGRLEAQGPPVLAARADLSEFNLAPRRLARPGGARDRPADQREPADPPPLAHRPPADRLTATLAEGAKTEVAVALRKYCVLSCHSGEIQPRNVDRKLACHYQDMFIHGLTIRL
jgi:hypothetical protein